MQKWEYKVLGKVNEIEFNELGKQGWELVGIAMAVDYRYGCAVFKRPTS
jgi:hypothetical protein